MIRGPHGNIDPLWGMYWLIYTP